MLREKLNQVLVAKKPFISDPINFVSIGISVLLNVLHLGILYAKIKPSSAQVLLHYNVVYGLTYVEKSFYVYWIPLLALLLFIANLIFAVQLYQKEKLASYFLVISSIVLQMIFFAASLALIVANE